MAQYIDKAALVEEITHKIKVLEAFVNKFDGISDKVEKAKNKIEALGGVLLFIKTLEEKEVQEEPVSEDLEEAAIDYDSCRPALYGVDDEGDYVECIEVLKDAFIAGAKWGKNQAKVEIQAQSMALAHGCPKEHISEELEEAAKNVGQKYFPNENNIWARPNYEAVKAECAFKDGAKWQKEQFEKNRLAACDRQTEEEAQRESDFVMDIITKEHRQPTFDDAIKYGMKLQKEQMMKNAISAKVTEIYYPTDSCLEIEATLPEGRFEDGDKVLIIKED